MQILDMITRHCGALITSLFLLISLVQSCSNCKQSSNLGERIQDWFHELGRISRNIEQECTLLPKADSIAELEERLKNLAVHSNSSFNKCKEENAKTKAKVTVLEGRLKVVEEALRKLTIEIGTCNPPFKGQDALSGKIPYGNITCTGLNSGDVCKIKCNPGSYNSGRDRVTCRRGMWDGQFPSCKPAHSCQDHLRSDEGNKDGIYKLWSENDDEQFDAYCDMTTDQGGWTLISVVANDGTESWSYSDPDKDYGDLQSLWENSLTLGQLSKSTPNTAKDYKGKAYFKVPGREVLLTLKGKPYIQTDGRCLNGNTLKRLLNVYRFSCAGSSYNCFYGKCLGVGGTGVSTFCHHGCKVTKFYSSAAQAGEPLSAGKKPTLLYLKSGEAETAQDGNKDRVYFSTAPARTNVDFVNGLGAFTALGRKITSLDVSLHKDVAEKPSDKTLFYGIYVR